jgi:NAD(P)-dependent dehydrogenase (short-subunit alcohol dehydrogenase family)
MTRPFSYEGKRVIVTGAASGMGAATVAMLSELGAEVHALDVRPIEGPVAKAYECDCGDPDAIDLTVGLIGGPVHGLFNVAGVPQTQAPLQVLGVNFLGLRHMTEAVLPLIPDGGAIAHVASLAGSGWQTHLAEIDQLLATPDFASGRSWGEEHLAEYDDPYFFSKECVIVYTMRRSRETLLQSGVRMNCISPGPVDSPMMVDFRQALGDKTIDWTAEQACGRLGRPDEMAGPLVFLNSDDASYVSGHNLIVDAGFTPSLNLGTVDFAGLA